MAHPPANAPTLLSTMNTKQMVWVSVEDRLPMNGQAVLVRYTGNNWRDHHVLADGVPREHWRWQAAKFIEGRTAEEMKSSRVIHPQDEHGNNERPYFWWIFGPGELFGQDVSHWAAITDPMEEDFSPQSPPPS